MIGLMLKRCTLDCACNWAIDQSAHCGSFCKTSTSTLVSSGQRVYDFEGTALGEVINLLTVVPNQSYQAFAEDYQQEINEAYGKDTNAAAPLRENRAGRVQKKVLQRRDDLFATQAFQQFWESMARTTRYTVAFDEEQLVQEVVPQLRNISISGCRNGRQRHATDVLAETARRLRHTHARGQLHAGLRFGVSAKRSPRHGIERHPSSQANRVFCGGSQSHA